jgi:hypothetical protein
MKKLLKYIHDSYRWSYSKFIDNVGRRIWDEEVSHKEM